MRRINAYPFSSSGGQCPYGIDHLDHTKQYALFDVSESPKHEALLPDSRMAVGWGKAEYDGESVSAFQRTTLCVDERPIVPDPLVALHPVQDRARGRFVPFVQRPLATACEPDRILVLPRQIVVNPPQRKRAAQATLQTIERVLVRVRATSVRDEMSAHIDSFHSILCRSLPRLQELGCVFGDAFIGMFGQPTNSEPRSG